MNFLWRWNFLIFKVLSNFVGLFSAFSRFSGPLTTFSGFLRFLRLSGLATHPVLDNERRIWWTIKFKTRKPPSMQHHSLLQVFPLWLAWNWQKYKFHKLCLHLLYCLSTFHKNESLIFFSLCEIAYRLKKLIWLKK